jgi:two-component system response regulator FixJ
MPDERRPVAVVDDDDAVRDSLRFLLEASGFEVLTFVSACQFLSAIERDGVACALLDQHMPGVTGLELLRRLHQRFPAMPVALMTGSPSPELTRQALALGAAVVLDKPLAEPALLRFVGQAIG